MLDDNKSSSKRYRVFEEEVGHGWLRRKEISALSRGIKGA